MANETRKVTIYINGKEIENSIRGIRAESVKLKNELNNMTRGTAEYEKKVKEFNKLDSVISDHNSKLKGTAGIWGSIKEEVKQFGAMAIAYLGAGQLVSGIDSVITRSAALEDTFADVAKTTGLTIEQVSKLNDQLSSIDTRSSRQELLDLAVIAGKLGITAEEDIFKFVESADKINVALSADLGGNIEETVKDLGKLSELFGGKQKFGIGEDLNKIGSAINTLGSASTASEGYLVEFAKRLGGIAPAANLSLPNVLAYGSALDQLGQTAEVSSTTLTQVIPAMFKTPELFAAKAGVSVTKFKEILEKDTNEAFMLFLDGIKGSSGGLEELSKNLDDMGFDGTRAIGVLGALANNTELITKEINLANQAYEDGVSLTEEFSVKNSTLGAVLDKLNKKIQATFVSGKLNNTLKSWAYWIEQNWNAIVTFGSKLTKIVLVIAAYKALLIGTEMVMKGYRITTLALAAAKAMATANATRMVAAERLLATTTVHSERIMKLAAASTHLMSAAKLLLTGRIKQAAVAFRAFSLALNTNPIVLVGTVLATVAATFFLFKNKVAEATEEQVKFNQQLEEALRITDSITSIEDRMAVVGSLTKAQLQTLKEDIEAAMVANEQHGAHILSAKKKYNKDIVEEEAKNKEKLYKLEQQYANASTVLEQDMIRKQIDLFKQYFADSQSNVLERTAGMSEITNNANSKELSSYLAMVNKKLGASETYTQAVTAANEQAVQAETSRLDSLKSSWQKFQDFLDKATDDNYKASLSQKEKELYEIEQKYAEQIQFLEDQGLKETELYKELVLQRETEVGAVILEEKEKLAELIQDLEDEIFLDNMQDLQEKAFHELELEKQKELEKIADLENAEEAKILIDEKYKFKASQMQRKFDEAAEQQRLLKKAKEKQEREEIISATGAMLGEIAGMLNEGSKGWKALKIGEALINTYMAASNAMASAGNPIAGAILAGVAAVQGMIQVRAIMKTEIPQIQEQYYDGGYANVVGPKDGKNYKAKKRYNMYGGYVAEPTLVNGGSTLGGEKGLEYWVNNNMMRIPMVSSITQALESLRTQKISVPEFGSIISSITANRQFEYGGYSATVKPFQTSSTGASSNDMYMLKMLQLMDKMNKNLENPTPNYSIFEYDYFTERMDIMKQIEEDARG